MRRSSAEHGLGSNVPQGDSQDDNPPEHAHRVVAASLAPSRAKRVEQLAVGQSGEQILDGLQRKGLLSSRQSQAKSSLAAWTIIMGDGPEG